MKKTMIFVTGILLTLLLNSNSFGEIKQLTNFNTPNQYTNWSSPSITADGKYIYFISSNDINPGSNPNRYSQIFKIDVITKTICQISSFTEEMYITGLKVSGDGSCIAFTGQILMFNMGISVIWTMNPDGTGLNRITETNAQSYFQSISYNGGKIIYIVASEVSGTPYVYINMINRDGTGRQVIHSATWSNTAYNTIISGDSTKVLFATNDGLLGAYPTSYQQFIYTMNADGSDLRLVLNDDNVVWTGPYFPVFNNSGDRTLFISSTDYGNNPTNSKKLYLINVTNGDKKELSDYILPNTFITGTLLSGDGSKVIFNNQCITISPCEHSLKSVNSDGSNTRSLVVSTGSGNIGPYDANNDGAVVVFSSTDDLVAGSNPNHSDELFAYIEDGYFQGQTGGGQCGGGGGGQGNLQVTPTSYNFGDQTVFTCGTPQIFTLSNNGNANINVSSITTSLSVSNNKIFELIYDWGSSPCNQSNPIIMPGASGSCTVGITFCPATSGSVNDNLTVISNSSNSTINVPIIGVGIQPQEICNPPKFIWAQNELAYGLFEGVVNNSSFGNRTSADIILKGTNIFPGTGDSIDFYATFDEPIYDKDIISIGPTGDTVGDVYYNMRVIAPGAHASLKASFCKSGTITINLDISNATAASYTMANTIATAFGIPVNQLASLVSDLSNPKTLPSYNAAILNYINIINAISSGKISYAYRELRDFESNITKAITNKKQAAEIINILFKHGVRVTIPQLFLQWPASIGYKVIKILNDFIVYNIQTGFDTKTMQIIIHGN